MTRTHQEQLYFEEHQRRIYYQDIVYKVCDLIDRKLGGRTVCGTLETPNRDIIERLKKALRSQ